MTRLTLENNFDNIVVESPKDKVYVFVTAEGKIKIKGWKRLGVE